LKKKTHSQYFIANGLGNTVLFYSRYLCQQSPTLSTFRS